MHEKLRIYKKALDELLKKSDHSLTTNEISEKLNIPVKEIEEYQLLLGSVVSLNTVVGIDESCELSDLIAKEEDEPFDQKLMDECLENDIFLAFNEAGLSEREQKILTLRYGLNNEEAKTLAQVAQEYGITHERVRQIEFYALLKIKKSPRALKILSEYSNTPDRDYNYMTRHLKVKTTPYYKIKNKTV